MRIAAKIEPRISPRCSGLLESASEFEIVLVLVRMVGLVLVFVEFEEKEVGGYMVTIS